MAGTIKVRVMYSEYGRQKPYRQARVSLGYAGGVSDRRLTDSDGTVRFDALDWWGAVTVYVEGSEVGPRIDPAGQAADHDDPALREVTGEA